MTDWQRQVSDFAHGNHLLYGPAVHALDVVSEAGEVAKEVLLATNYGRREFQLRPELVDMSKARDWMGSPDTPVSFKRETISRPPDSSSVYAVPYWSSLTEIGVYGAPTKATKEKGEQFLKAAVEGLIEVIREVKQYPIRERVDHH